MVFWLANKEEEVEVYYSWCNLSSICDHLSMVSSFTAFNDNDNNNDRQFIHTVDNGNA